MSARLALERSFYERPTLVVARELLGKLLVRRLRGRRLSGMIVETEAYIGEEDTACHASRGRTARTEVMFGPPGHAYVYFTYGMHWMLNVVTEPPGRPAAVLIRAVEPVEGIETIRELRPGRRDLELTSGPARVCAALAIERAQNGTDLVEGLVGGLVVGLVGGPELIIEPYRDFRRAQVATGGRVGIDYAAPRDRRAQWRFWLRDHPYVSRTPSPRAPRRVR